MDRLYLFINNSKNRLDGSLLYQWKDSLWINPKLANLSPHTFPSRKKWVTLNLIFPTVIKASISSITKHPRDISPSSKRNINQIIITFQPNISKLRLLSLLHSIYNSIKFNNQSSIIFKKYKKNSNKLFHTPMKIPPQIDI